MSGVQKLISAATQGNLQEVKFIIENEGIGVNSKDGVMNEYFYFIVYYFLFYFRLELQQCIGPVVMVK